MNSLPLMNKRLNLAYNWRRCNLSRLNSSLWELISLRSCRTLLCLTAAETSWIVFWWSSEPRWTWTTINILLSKRSSDMPWLECLIKSRTRFYFTVWITLSIFQIWLPLRNLCEHPLETLTDKAPLRPQSMNSVNAIRSSASTWQNLTVTSATLTGMKQLERQLYWQESLLSSVTTSFP